MSITVKALDAYLKGIYLSIPLTFVLLILKFSGTYIGYNVISIPSIHVFSVLVIFYVLTVVDRRK